MINSLLFYSVGVCDRSFSECEKNVKIWHVHKTTSSSVVVLKPFTFFINILSLQTLILETIHISLHKQINCNQLTLGKEQQCRQTTEEIKCN